MDYRLILTILFVTLSWVTMGTYAQITTASPNVTSMANMTQAPNVTMSNVTTMANMTEAPMSNVTTMANMTEAPMSNATAMPTMTDAPNVTMMSTNMTVAPNATVVTMPVGGNLTGGNVTAEPNMTTTPSVTTTVMTTEQNTTVPPTNATLVINTTVETLPSSISSSGCGSERLCAAEPSSCDPSVSGSCFFLSAKQRGNNFEFELAGDSDGYMAATLASGTSLGANDTTYVCANNNSAVQFFSTVLRNGELVPVTLEVSSVKGRVNGRNIQCTFLAALTGPRSRSTRASTFSLAVSSGSFDSTTGTLGAPRTQLQTPTVNLADPTANITNLVANTTSAPNTTDSSYSTVFQHSQTQVLLFSVGLLSLTLL